MKGPWNIDNPLTDDGRNKINEMFQELYNEYREAGFNAKEARNKAEQAVSDALIAKETAEVTREEMLEIIREQTRNGDLAPEIAQARQGHGTLGENLNSIKTELVQTDKQLESIENANADVILKIPNYLNNYQNTHPKVISFDSPWNGYKYWMAFTPYPDGDTSAENPSVVVSNDLINWINPPGNTNPIDGPPSGGYNSDTHIVYNYDRDEIEIWYRAYIRDNDHTYIYRKRSSDGRNWSDRELMFHNTTQATDMLSPAVIYEDGIYKVWSILRTSRNIHYIESTDSTASSWTNEQETNVRDVLTPWHIDVEKTDLGYEMLITSQEGSFSTQDLYHMILKFDGTLTTPNKVIQRGSGPYAHDKGTIYRSCLLKEDGIYYVFYAARSLDFKYTISLATGRNVTGLNGLKTLEPFSVDKRSTTAVLSGNQTIEEFDVSELDTIIVSGASNITIKSLKGATHDGHKLTIALNHYQATVTFENTGRIQVPGGKEWTMSYDKQSIVDLVCTNSNPSNNQFKVGVNQFNNKERYAEINSASTLTDFDVSNVDTILISRPTTIKSFRGGHKGQRVSVITTATAEVVIENSTRIITPDRNNYVFDNGGVTLVCTNDNGDSFRGFV